MHACNQTVRVKPNGCSILKVKPKLKYFSFTDFGSSRYVLLVRYIARLIFDDIVHLITLTGTKPYGCYALSSSISFPTMSTHMPSSTTSYGITPWKPAAPHMPTPMTKTTSMGGSTIPPARAVARAWRWRLA
jgi:hypothetical protein